jgi:hypothetical protein
VPWVHSTDTYKTSVDNRYIKTYNDKKEKSLIRAFVIVESSLPLSREASGVYYKKKTNKSLLHTVAAARQIRYSTNLEWIFNNIA